MKRRQIVLLVLGLAALGQAQEWIPRRALMLPVPRSLNRGLLSIDPVEKQVVTGLWRAPKAGQSVLHADTVLAAWQEAQADSSGWFEHAAQGGGYAYVDFNAARDTTVLIQAMGSMRYWVNGVPHAGLKYAVKDDYESWEPRFDYGPVPVRLHQGMNDLLFYTNRGRFKVRVKALPQPVFMHTQDMTLPDLVAGETGSEWGGIMVVNGTDRTVKGLCLFAVGEGGAAAWTPVSDLPPQSVRKAAFRIPAMAGAKPGTAALELRLWKDLALVDQTTLSLGVKDRLENHKRTYVSAMDGSVQYYAVNPCRDPDPAVDPALVLSVHGASVEAVNQAGAYAGKSWATLVAATNRRPYGYDWEDWGRMEAMEALADAKKRYAHYEERVYLTGHSMGGHGTWHLGVTYPDQWAAIAPSAGWISFDSYAPRQGGPVGSSIEAILDRSRRPSQTLLLKQNYEGLPIYALHGGADDVVGPDQARQMVAEIDTFHQDWMLHVEPGQGHWWDLSDEDGTDCVDWAPLFDFFGRHARPPVQGVRRVVFKTASPGVSARRFWAAIEGQERELEISSIDIQSDPHKRRFTGVTQNVSRLSLDCSVLMPGDAVTLRLDGDTLVVAHGSDRLDLMRRDGAWTQAAPLSPAMKGPHRYGPFKEAWSHRVVLVYGTQGHAEENAWAYAKARFDAEQWWAQGNGSVDVIPDTDFDPQAEPDRSVVLYGHAQSNAAYKPLLGDGPVQLTPGKVRIDGKTVKGKGLACLLVRPRPGSDVALVGVVGGTDLQGMRLTDNRPYLYSGYALPDVTVFGLDGVRVAGFFGPDWGVESGEIAYE